jgi:hypothetical protein
VLHQTLAGSLAVVAQLLLVLVSILSHAVTSWLAQPTLLVVLLNAPELHVS